jgi:hypothetical protein
MKNLLDESQIAIVKHSLGEHIGGPAEALEKYLARNSASFCVLSHPLNRESNPISLFKKFSGGKLVSAEQMKRKWVGPISFIFDVGHSPKLKDQDLIFCFNPWAVILSRVLGGRKPRVIFWGVDFVPQTNRFNLTSFLYKITEKLSMSLIDFQLENNEFALEIRRKSFQILESKLIPHRVVPITHDFPDKPIPTDKNSILNLLYVGGINERNGSSMLPFIAESLRKHIEIHFHVVGGGTGLEELNTLIRKLELNAQFTIYGQLKDEKIPEIAALCQFGLAPYKFDRNLFTVFADPGKYVFYTAFGLIGVSSIVPLILDEYITDAGFVGMREEDSAECWAQKILDIFNDIDEINSRRTASYHYGLSRKTDSVMKSLFDDLSKKLLF